MERRATIGRRRFEFSARGVRMRCFDVRSPIMLVVLARPAPLPSATRPWVTGFRGDDSQVETSCAHPSRTVDEDQGVSHEDTGCVRDDPGRGRVAPTVSVRIGRPRRGCQPDRRGLPRPDTRPRLECRPAVVDLSQDHRPGLRRLHRLAEIASRGSLVMGCRPSRGNDQPAQVPQ